MKTKILLAVLGTSLLLSACGAGTIDTKPESWVDATRPAPTSPANPADDTVGKERLSAEDLRERLAQAGDDTLVIPDGVVIDTGSDTGTEFKEDSGKVATRLQEGQTVASASDDKALVAAALQNLARRGAFNAAHTYATPSGTKSAESIIDRAAGSSAENADYFWALPKVCGSTLTVDGKQYKALPQNCVQYTSLAPGIDLARVVSTNGQVATVEHRSFIRVTQGETGQLIKILIAYSTFDVTLVGENDLLFVSHVKPTGGRFEVMA